MSIRMQPKPAPAAGPKRWTVAEFHAEWGQEKYVFK